MELNAIESLVKELIPDHAEPNNTYNAVVSQIDNDGTVWVNVAGGTIDTPTASKSSEVEVGDSVTVEWRANKLYIAGNASNPSAGSIRVDAVERATEQAMTAAQSAVQDAGIAREAAESAQADAESAHTAATNAQTSASNALTAAQNAQKSADSALVSLSTVEDVVGVLNWITAHGTMTANGSTALDPSKVYFIRDNNGDYHVGNYYYSIVSEPKAEERTSYYTLSIDESVQNYVATHVVVDTEGLWLIPDSGGNKVLIATGAGSSYTTAGTYIIGKVSGVDTVFAKFTTDGVTMNATNNTQIAHLGYGTGTSQSGTSTAPFYSLGVRGDGAGQVLVYDPTETYSVGDLTRYNNALYRCKTAITTPEAFNPSHWGVPIGNYSIVEGYGNVASDYSSHSEGWGNVSEGLCSHTEGLNTYAEECAHAEGASTEANGYASHSEGVSTRASGKCSHAQNMGTYASQEAQTALGKYNVDDTTSAVIIGNGTAGNARSNALTVDWNGNVNIARGAKYKVNGKNLSASDVNALPISGGTMTGNGQIINGHITNSSSRETTPNLTPTGKRGITALLASSAMTTNRPGEGTIIHCEWDNDGGWNSQLFIADNDSGNGKPFVAVRGQRSGTWTAWDKLLSESTVTDYVIAQSQSATSYGDGYWRWREWNSGKVEIWYHGSLTLTTADTAMGGVKRYSRWFNLPNSYSLYRCTCIVNGMQEGAWYGCGGTRDSSGTGGAEPVRSIQVMGYRIASNPPTEPANLNIYICGQKTK